MAPVLIYSMWSGYWNGSEDQKMESVLKIRNLFAQNNIYDIHTSGHADCTTLGEVCQTTNPRIAICLILTYKGTKNIPLSQLFEHFSYVELR